MKRLFQKHSLVLVFRAEVNEKRSRKEPKEAERRNLVGGNSSGDVLVKARGCTRRGAPNEM